MKQWNAAKPAASLGSGCLLLLIAIVLTVLSVISVEASGNIYTAQNGVIVKVVTDATGCNVSVKYGNWWRVSVSVFRIDNTYECRYAYVPRINRVVRVYRTNGKVTGISLPRP